MNKFSPLLSLCLLSTPLWSQVPVEGIQWERYEPRKVIHLCNEVGKHMMYDWSAYQELSTSVGRCASYAFDPATETETFQVYGKNSNRVEIRLINEYEFGARQFEGYLTFDAPLNDECLMQIWGSARGATQLMFRGFAKRGGHVTANCGSVGRTVLMDNCYGREIKVNIIHLQEDVGNKFIVYLDDRKVMEVPDNEKAVNNFNGNYHKYGLYGTVRDGHESPKVVWRKVRHYRNAGGVVAERLPQKLSFPELPAKKAGDADFAPGASLESGLPLIYRTSDVKVATVTGDGKIKIVGPGTTWVLAFHEGNQQYEPVSLMRSLTVTK